jgi:hypothetical protein
VVCRSAHTVSVPDFRHDALSAATPGPVKGRCLETQLKTLLTGT